MASENPERDENGTPCAMVQDISTGYYVNLRVDSDGNYIQ